MPIRNDFPEEGSTLHGGLSDGYEFRVVFTGNRLADVYSMVRAFLEEEGYAEVPVPATVEEFRKFRAIKRHQPGLFDLSGYVHNPIKILFLPTKQKRITLALHLYNEHAEGHLLRFHGVL